MDTPPIKDRAFYLERKRKYAEYLDSDHWHNLRSKKLNLTPTCEAISEKFAHAVLVELASIRAAVEALADVVIGDVVLRTGEDPRELKARFNRARDNRQGQYYADLVREVGLPVQKKRGDE